MTERERNAAVPNADPDEPEIERSSSDPPSAHKDAMRPTDQAISNQEQALESGEENVV
jgi:hypothetical protein